MKDTLNTVFFGLCFGIFMVLSIVFFIPYWILKLPGLEKQFDKFTHRVTSGWGKYVFLIGRCSMTVNGIENLPEHRRFILIGNHQSSADIPFLMASLPMTIGFIAKRELNRIPILNLWMRAVHCIFVERGNFRGTMRDIETGINDALRGYPKVIFPEGTRSRSERMAAFKPGSILLAAKAGITIVPVTIDGTFRTFEEKNRICSTDLRLTIHPYIETEKLSDDECKKLSDKIRNIIAGALPNRGK